MNWTKNHHRSGTPHAWRRRIGYWPASGALLLLGVVLLAAQQASQTGRPAPAATPATLAIPQSGSQNADAANAQRKKQIADDSARLLQLATDLKAEVDKTDKDTLSLTVIRKADEIEKLAHSVKERTRLTLGVN
jgi:hypothetical protein